MKTKELIRQLQKADPTGELETCVLNEDIHFVDTLPALYDGKLQVLTRDDSKNCYNIIGGKYVVKGHKVVIFPISITDALWNDPDMPVDYSELNSDSVSRYMQSDDLTRQSSRNVDLKISMESFYRWVEKKAQDIRPEVKDCLPESERFFQNHLNVDDPVKDLPAIEKYGYKVYPSYNERQEAYWEDRIEVIWNGGWEIKEKSEHF